MSSVLDIANKLNKEFGSGTFLTKSDVIPQYRRLKSRAFGLSYPLFGGLPYGRICTFSGKQHSGKSTAVFAAIADYQRENPTKTCLFVDVEHSLDLQFQVMMHGIDTTHLYVMEPEVGMSGEQILSAVMSIQLESDDIGLIAIDSVAALDTAQNLSSDFEKDNGKRATIASALHKFCKEIVASLFKKGNILILVNQVRVSGTTFTGAPIYTEPGGDAPKYYSSVSVRFGTRSFMKGDEELKGENSGDGADGFKIKFVVTKNKTAPCNRGGGFITYRYVQGMDWLFDLLQIAVTFDFIHRVNNVTYELVNLETGELYKSSDGKDLRGKKADLIKYIKDDIDFQNEYVSMLQNHISSDNTLKTALLDDETSMEIEQEENSIKEV